MEILSSLLCNFCFCQDCLSLLLDPDLSLVIFFPANETGKDSVYYNSHFWSQIFKNWEMTFSSYKFMINTSWETHL